MESILYTSVPNPISAVQYYTVFAIIWRRQLSHNYWGNRTPLPPKQSYDFIVIGAGSAGSTVSCRLAQAGCADVLLLEAGGAQDAIITDEPGVYITSLREVGVKVWNYTNTPQPKGGQVSYDCLDICSKLNYFIFRRIETREYSRQKVI